MRIEIIDAADVNSNLVTFHISPAVFQYILFSIIK